ncbi:Uma2 family endonuclease [Edaphobacter aggregans]|uniref:Uma2 family endonuclease n=1 Tax=Edaphobacter aggregans TaxID=570835 RepID=UPI00054F0BD8|nr:Uma2 family endonuclease [Edaphobacter aggregans]
MATAHAISAEERFISEEEYLRTSYRPDCDYVDGRVEERNVGEYERGRVLHLLDRIFGNHEKEWGVITVPECRLQVGPKRLRIPDLLVLRRGQKVNRIVREAPLLCIEVLSPEDTWAKIRARLNDYLTMGVEHVWCFDSDAREARRYTADGFEVVREAELAVAGTSIQVNVAEVFSVLDQD